MKNVLFICGKARQRSPTAAQIFEGEFETDAAGLSNDADVQLSPEQIDWATHIVVMEKAHTSRLRQKFSKHVSGKRIICLDIADKYTFMAPDLIDLLKSRVNRIK